MSIGNVPENTERDGQHCSMVKGNEGKTKGKLQRTGGDWEGRSEEHQLPNRIYDFTIQQMMFTVPYKMVDIKHGKTKDQMHVMA